MKPSLSNPSSGCGKPWPARLAEALRPLLPFFLALGIALAAAAVAPKLGASGGPLRTEKLTGWAVVLIFLIQGMQLPADQVRRGFAAWKTHLFCQGWMFLAYPALAWLVVLAFGSALGPAQRVGLLYLSMLPTTVATNAAFSSRAGGNTAVALFNIVAGNLLGVLIGPAWLAWLLARGTGASVDLWPLVRTIVLQLVVPFAIGQALRLRLHGWVERHRTKLRDVASWLIFFIVYTAVCNLKANPSFASDGGNAFAGVAATLALLGVGTAACWLALRLLGWSHDLKVAAFYAASQKTLAAGLPIAGAVYAAAGDPADLPPLALLVLPLVIFHIGQLIGGALLIPVLARGGR